MSLCPGCSAPLISISPLWLSGPVRKFLWECGSSKHGIFYQSMDCLRRRNAQLEAENAGLKTQLAKEYFGSKA